MEVSGFPHGRFTLQEITPSTHWITGWVGPIVGLDAAGKKKKSLVPAGDRTTAVHSVARLYTD